MSDKEHSQKFADMLCGKKIVACRYLNNEEAESFGWYSRPLVIFLDDGTALIPQSDDEGNDGGAIYLNNVDKKTDAIIYVLS